MNIEKQKQLAELFQKLHKVENMFVIPNVWNVGSAYVFQKQGFSALATTSAGIAYSLGYPDGQDINIEDLALCVSQITRRIDIPLSVDFERGYSENIEQIKENARKILSCGVVGFNIEDGKANGTLDDINFMVKKVQALSELKKETGINFVINARTCTYWLNVADEETKKKIAIKRGNAYKQAGADCVFIPGVMDEATIKQFIDNINAPLNIILNPKYNDFEGLSKIGVRRLSVGSGPVRSMYNQLIEMADELKNGNVSKIINHKFTYRDANKYFDK